MGTWGTGIYSNDIASDVKDICNEIFPFMSVEDGNKIIFNEYRDLLNSEIKDNEYASFWYSLSDWQWKHGILSTEICQHTIQLLRTYTGIDEWKESGHSSDVKKRMTVLDKLRHQLETPMPSIKIPKKKLLTPLHKPGTIIIFRSFGEKSEYNRWVIKRIRGPWLYESDHIRNDSPTILPKPFNGDNKYYAVLCVGTTKILHSQFIPNIYDEYSVYAFYDYCENQIPTLPILTKCGFLPMFTSDYDSSTQYYINTGWTYQFYTNSKFNYKYEHQIDYFNKIFDLSEPTRFYKAIEEKQNLNIPVWKLDLIRAFDDFFDEKIRASICGFQIDTLLNSTRNPNLLDKVARKKYEYIFSALGNRWMVWTAPCVK